ncbi:uncharacterized protein VTP21DRAFT_1334 [Calcarisporiella thermophila]|uniref:uncharacterized protein n=1 Tax=Calcarisporiella thermophila TaxID=911321 RepID=UPI0037443DA8
MLFKSAFIPSSIALILAASSAVAIQGQAGAAPIITPNGADVIENRYIVVLKDTATTGQIDKHHRRVRRALSREGDELEGLLSAQGKVDHVFDSDGFNGYAGHFSKQVIEKIRKDPVVDFIERDSKIRVLAVQKNAPWGLARISHRPKLNSVTKDKYLYNPKALGQGTTVYVVDTGINVNHQEFEGRASVGKTFTKDGPEDGFKHGTHVAGIVAGKTYGVAKKAKIVSVKVLDNEGNGTYADLIAALQWVQSDAKNKIGKAIVNLSLGGKKSESVNKMVETSIHSGLIVVAAAGNYFDDACDYSPASAKGVITVAASNINDKISAISNYGNCTTLIAPGEDIPSAWPDSNNATSSETGTSMAAPHVSGVIAGFISSGKPLNHEQAKKLVLKGTTNGVVGNLDQATPNRLLFNNPPKF